MGAVNKLRAVPTQRAMKRTGYSQRLHLIKGSLSSKKVARQAPLVAGFHKAVDGALVGVLMATALMSAFTLHWQHLWIVAFNKLESTRDLSHRLTESTAIIERHLLQETGLPKSMVPTKAANLLYLDRFQSSAKSSQNSFKNWSKFTELVQQPSNHGY